MIQKVGVYAIVAGLILLLYSTTKISLITLSTTTTKNDILDLPPIHRDRDHDVGNTVGDSDAHSMPPIILPINQRKFDADRGNTGPGGVRDVLPGLLSLSSQTRSIDETSLPYPCGAIVYIHFIPGDAGDALNEWIAELVESNESASLISSEEYDSKQLFINEVETNISTIGPKEWKIINSHANHGLSFSSDEQIFHSWRKVVEQQRCKFVTAAIFSDPLDHSIKHTKRRFAQCNCGTEEFDVNIMQDVTSSNPWMGQLDRFLFNTIDEVSSAMVTKDKVKRAIKLLIDHFDLVLVDGKGNAISDLLLRITGWSSSTRPRKAVISNDDEGPSYSKNLVNAFSKMSAKNGDADFIDAVNHVYFNSLGYLLLQEL